MRILITSDLHTDINQTYNFGFISKMDEVDLTVIAGDISGSYNKEIKFFESLPEHSNPVIAVPGNHLGYEFKHDSIFLTCPILGTKDNGIFSIKRKLEDIPNTYYLENEYVELYDKIVFGGCMYSDFNLYGKKYNKTCKNIAKTWMNDFRYVRVNGRDETSERLPGTRAITPDDYHKRFKKFKHNLIKCANATTKDIIVVSHFAPSKKSISEYYGHFGRPSFNQPGWALNAAYASNLEQLIKNNPRIKLWIHGHMHDSFDYMINQCRVICYPYGYKYDTTVTPQNYLGKIVNI